MVKNSESGFATKLSSTASALPGISGEVKKMLSASWKVLLLLFAVIKYLENFISNMFTTADHANTPQTKCLLDGLVLQILSQNITRKVVEKWHYLKCIFLMS